MRGAGVISKNNLLIAIGISMSLVVAVFGSSRAGLFGGGGGGLGGLVSAVASPMGAATGIIPGLGGVLSGGGAAGAILGAPGQVALGGAIKEWEAANSRTLDKAGTLINDWERVNNGTVAKFNAGLESNIKKLEGILDKSIFDVNNANAAIDKLDAAVGRQMASLDQLFSRTTTELDGALLSAISELDQSLERQVGNLGSVGLSTATALEVTFRNVIIFAALIGFLAASFWQVNQQILKGPAERSFKKLSTRIAGFAALFLTLTAASFMMPAQTQYREMLEETETAYRTSMDGFDFVRANYYASKLRFADDGNPKYSGYFNKTAVLRDIFLRPAVYGTPEGVQKLADNIDYADYYFQKSGALDPDLAVASAFVIAQRDRSRIGAIIAANIAADALSNGLLSERRDTTKLSKFLIPMALNYVAGYLRAPITDDQFTVVYGRSRNEENQRLRDIATAQGNKGAALQYRSIPEIKDIYDLSLKKVELNGPLYVPADPLLSKASYPGVSIVVSAGPAEIVVNSEIALRETYYRAMNHYIDMIVAYATAAAQTQAEEKLRHLTRSKDSAAKIKLLFDSLLSSQLSEQQAVQMGLMKGLHAIYTRAHQYSGLSDVAATVPSTLVYDVNTEKDKGRVLFLKLVAKRGVDSTYGPQSGVALSNYFAWSFRKQEQALIALEDSMLRFLRLTAPDGTRVASAADISSQAAYLGLSTLSSDGATQIPFAIKFGLENGISKETLDSATKIMMNARVMPVL